MSWQKDIRLQSSTSGEIIREWVRDGTESCVGRKLVLRQMVEEKV
jgi:hypothetical protein